MDNISKLWTFLVVAAISFFVLSYVNAQADTSYIDVTVSGITIVDIAPNQTTFSSLYPTNTSAATQFTITNKGSQNITSMYLKTTAPASDPSGSDDPTDWDAGNFVQVQNTSDTKYYYVLRKEFNESPTPAYITLPLGTCLFGSFDFGENQYFYAVNHSSADGCDDLDLICVSSSAKNATSTGDLNLQDNCAQLVNGSSFYAYGEVTIEQGHNYCVAAPNNSTTGDTSNVWLFKWYNPEEGAETIPWDEPTNCKWDGNLYEGQLGPDQYISVNVRVQVPKGVASGSVTTGELTVYAASA